jgi:uncharacterized protein (DUF1778 family)
MAKASRAKRNLAKSKPEESPSPRDGFVTLSVRVTGPQHELLSRAAKLRGWTPTHLLRVAASERAVHIINTSPEYAPNLFHHAVEAARRLVMKPTAYTVASDEPTRVQMDVVDTLFDPEVILYPGNEHPVEIIPREFTTTQWEAFQRAAKLGGAEFLSLIISAADLALNPRSAPEPIDPEQFTEKE